MRNYILILLLAFTVCVFANPVKPLVITPGTYGACSCTDTNHTGTALRLNDNGTLTWYDFSGANPVEVNGTWMQEGNRLLLTMPGVSGIPLKWKTDKKYACIRGRKGLHFIRICDTEKCC